MDNWTFPVPRWAVLVILCLAVPIMAAGQDGISLGEAGNSVFEQSSPDLSGILDPSRLDMSHSLSMGYSSSSRVQRGGNFLGYYENRMSYQLADPLNLTFYLGYQFQPQAQQTDGQYRQEQILPGFALTYKPSDNFLMHFSYRKLGAQPFGTQGSFADRYMTTPWPGIAR